MARSMNMKQQIAMEFARMTRERPVDKITVKDLVERCRISRQTFYYHFQDILEVMEWSIRQLLEKALADSSRAAAPEEAIEAFIRVASEYGAVLLRLLDSQHRARVEELFVQTMAQCIAASIADRQPEAAHQPEALELATHFYAFGMVGIILKTCRDPTIDCRRLSRQLYQLLCGTLLDLSDA